MKFRRNQRMLERLAEANSIAPETENIVLKNWGNSNLLKISQLMALTGLTRRQIALIRLVWTKGW